MANPTAAMLVIGNEILSGRTRDSNLHHAAGALTARGIDLKEARVVADDHDAIIEALRTLSSAYTHVFTSGGIGPTHDDITADAVAAAFGVGIGQNEEAARRLMAFFRQRGFEASPERMRMARIPEGATLIDNPVSAAPGFTVNNVHVMAGVPRIFEAMLASVLATIEGGAPLESRSCDIGLPEADIARPLAEIAARHPSLSIGSYPYNRAGVFGANIVVRGHDVSEVEQAIDEISEAFRHVET